MPDAAPHLPLWALYLQAFGTIFAAVVAATIASAIQYRQWRLAQDKLRLDLFDRRARVYSALFSEIMVTDGDKEKQQAIIATKLDEMRDYRFLFDASTVDQIDKARLLLMRISAECDSISISHQRIMQLFRDFNEVRALLASRLIEYLRFA